MVARRTADSRACSEFPRRHLKARDQDKSLFKESTGEDAATDLETRCSNLKTYKREEKFAHVRCLLDVVELFRVKVVKKRF